ncbi:NADP oxidoreductase coenzyme F420-dependent [Cupriavidus taiwanensis]|uniref:NADP oxidoreductase coenzyme F420-dependent n=2 Tax=Cupriavidus taiwanensis TaxID=164546 RepID=A0A976AT97_9BURK|nr:NADP oxidoreductase coenzyme F420-dependent [Cupriavidus taiwanensis]SOZ49288.1 NADP oxidoreductase coenzyme F420-dependent [Cupriavidus taiwanensis]SOZ51919.1 NADP oxidoreductase coenzyme F420-dependent [Cupriavidus taiwanensis]SPA00151.1 NADP oxidoreductase coenzyme F420-dependent [Cupriavidus taiwanensis]SPA07119.1 NADP oxidoreductase coenzyme F420-dependent [Cupriavidus taiwanensis]
MQASYGKTIGVIGAGAIGTAFATALARHGIQAVVANSRGPETLRDAVKAIGPSIRPGTRDEAAAQDIVLVAVNWSKLPQALAGLPDFGGRIVIDANNPIEAPLFRPADLHGRSSSEVFADLVPGARVVKAFNHLQPALVAGDPQAVGGRRVMFLSGDDANAKAEVARLIDRLGFFGIDLGSLDVGGRQHQFPGGPLAALNLVRIGLP